MPQKPLNELSSEELNKQKSRLKIILIIYAVTAAVVIGINVYELTRNGKTSTITLLIGLLPLAMLTASPLRKVNAELKRREKKR